MARVIICDNEVSHPSYGRIAVIKRDDPEALMVHMVGSAVAIESMAKAGHVPDGTPTFCDYRCAMAKIKELVEALQVPVAPEVLEPIAIQVGRFQITTGEYRAEQEVPESSAIQPPVAEKSADDIPF